LTIPVKKVDVSCRVTLPEDMAVVLGIDSSVVVIFLWSSLFFFVWVLEWLCSLELWVLLPIGRGFNVISVTRRRLFFCCLRSREHNIGLWVNWLLHWLL